MIWEEVQAAWELFQERLSAYEETLTEQIAEAARERDLAQLQALQQTRKQLSRLRAALRKVELLLHSSYFCGVIALIGLVWGQVGLWGAWGGHTSQNDLVAPDEQWHRFYSSGGIGVRLLATRRLQPGLHWEAGSFISQDRSQRRFSRTSWSAVALSLRFRPLKRSLSPVAEAVLFRWNGQARDAQNRSFPGSPASVAVNGIGWNAGLSWRFAGWGEIALLYVRRRPQTPYIEGVNGPARDRIEGLWGQLTFLIGSSTEPPSRFR